MTQAQLKELAPREATADEVSSTPYALLARAVGEGADVGVIERLTDLYERWQGAMARQAFDRAIAAAKAEIRPVAKTREVDYTTSKGRVTYRHDDLAEIARVVDPILSAHGLSYRYRSAQSDQGLSVTCVVSHRDGYSEETTLTGPPDLSGSKNALQAIGSSATYLQRYTLRLALGLAAGTDNEQAFAPQQSEVPKVQRASEGATVPKAEVGEFSGVKVISVRMTEGVTDDKPWTLYHIKTDRGEYRTFSETAARNAKKAKDLGRTIQFIAGESKYGPEIEEASIEGDPE